MDESQLRRTQDLYFFGVSSPGATNANADQFCMPAERIDALSDLQQECVERGYYTPLQTKHKSSNPAGEILMLYRSASNDVGVVGHVDGRTAAGRHTIDNFRSIQGLSLGLTQLERHYPGFIFPKKELAGQVLRECTITDNPNFKNDTYIKFYHNDPGYVMDTLAEMTDHNGKERDPTRLIARLPQKLNTLPSVIKDYARKSQSFHISPKVGSAASAFRGLYQSLGSRGKVPLDPFFKTDPNFERQVGHSHYGPAKHRSHRTNYSASEPVFIGSLEEQQLNSDEQEERLSSDIKHSPTYSLFPEELLETYLEPSSLKHPVVPDFWRLLGTDMSAPANAQPTPSPPANGGIVMDLPNQSNAQPPAQPSADNGQEFLALLDQAKEIAKKSDESKTKATQLYDLIKELQKENPKANLSGLVEGIMNGKVTLNQPAGGDQKPADGNAPANAQPPAQQPTNANLPRQQLPLPLPNGNTAPLPNGVVVPVVSGNEGKPGQQQSPPPANNKEQPPAPNQAHPPAPIDPSVAKQVYGKVIEDIPLDRLPLAGAILQHTMKDLGITTKEGYEQHIADLQALRKKAADAEAETKAIKLQEEIRKTNTAAKVLLDRVMTGALKVAYDSKDAKKMAKVVGKENLERFGDIMRASITNSRPISMDDTSFIASIATTADANSTGTNQTAQARAHKAYDKMQSESEDLYKGFSFSKSSSSANGNPPAQNHSNSTPAPSNRQSSLPPPPQQKQQPQQQQEEADLIYTIDTSAEAEPADILSNFNNVILRTVDFSHQNGIAGMSRALGRKVGADLPVAEIDAQRYM